ncbi:anhydro-N-acetylmuramic acid kinase [Sulfurimonas sp.]
MSELYIGVMSGTSLDGVDIALCEINAKGTKLLKSQEFTYPKELKEEVLNIISTPVNLKTIGELDVKLGELFAKNINTFLHEHSINTKNIKAIGLHGQTLWHEPNSKYPFSMQLGSASVVHARTNITTISDFRNADIANGGEGAPFAPAFHKEVFSSLGENIAIVNIGGMANITYIGKNILGWDVGCGNVLLDAFMQRVNNKAYDKNGLFAKSGELNMELLQAMLKDSYFAKKAPKSTGREYFNETWLDKYLKNSQALKDEDVQRTLLELTAVIIANEANRLGVKELVLCGGGAKNLFLKDRLESLCKCKVTRSDTYGISSDFLEAMIFAWFAYKRVHSQSINLKSITGARKNTLLGAIYG